MANKTTGSVISAATSDLPVVVPPEHISIRTSVCSVTGYTGHHVTTISSCYCTGRTNNSVNELASNRDIGIVHTCYAVRTRPISVISTCFSSTKEWDAYWMPKPTTIPTTSRAIRTKPTRMVVSMAGNTKTTYSRTTITTHYIVIKVLIVVSRRY